MLPPCEEDVLLPLFVIACLIELAWTYLGIGCGEGAEVPMDGKL